MCKPHLISTATETLQLLAYHVIDSKTLGQGGMESLLEEVAWLAHAGDQEPLTMTDCAAAFLILSRAKADDTPAITERRRACAQLAEHAAREAEELEAAAH